MAKFSTPIEKVLSLYVPEPNTGCWLWLGFSAGKDYPQIRWGYKHLYAHRVTFEHFKGPIPKNLELDHTCSTSCCINPDHLEAVTHAENNKRTWNRGRSDFEPHLYGGSSYKILRNHHGVH